MYPTISNTLFHNPIDFLASALGLFTKVIKPYSNPSKLIILNNKIAIGINYELALNIVTIQN